MREGHFTIGGVTLGVAPYLITEAPKGFPSSPGIRTGSMPRPHQDGAYGGHGWAAAAQLELAGKIVGATSWSDLEAKATALIAACWVNESADLVVDTEARLRVMGVRSVGDAPIEIVESNSYTSADWRVTWEALDPRLYSGTIHSGVTALPLIAGGVAFPMAAPISFGDPAGGGSIVVVTTGSAPAPWSARIDGPISQPSITHQELGRTLTFDITLLAGEYLLIDSADRTVLLNGTASRYSTLRRPDWFDLYPGPALNTIRFNGTTGAGTLTFTWQDAWW